VTTTEHSTSSEVDIRTRQFFLWALAALDLPVEEKESDVFQLQIPPDWLDDFQGRDRILFTFDSERAGLASRPLLLALCSSLGQRILDQLTRRGPALHAEPQTQSVSVSELTARLFEAYRVDAGSLRLGGLSLEDRPLLRYTYAIGAAGGGSATRLVHVYASTDGRPIDDGLLQALGALRLAPFGGRPPRVSDEEKNRWSEYGRQHIPLVADGEQSDLLLVTAIWCKYVQGKVFFEIGEGRAETEFQGWAQLLVDGMVPPPPFQCPATGFQSYRLEALADGRITVPEAIAVCEESGRRALTSDLDSCCVTGRRVLPEYLETCPVSGDRLLPSVTVVCRQCRQSVSPRSIRSGRCIACRSMEPVTRDDPRVARLLGEHERLDRWSHWRLAETSRNYIVTARTMLRRLLVVVDKESLQVTYLADGNRFGSNWSEVPGARRKEYVD
jgi:hypothetical protein